MGTALRLLVVVAFAAHAYWSACACAWGMASGQPCCCCGRGADTDRESRDAVTPAPCSCCDTVSAARVPLAAVADEKTAQVDPAPCVADLGLPVSGHIHPASEAAAAHRRGRPPSTTPLYLAHLRLLN